MKSAIVQPRIASRRIAPFALNKSKSVHDPRAIDEIVHVINAFLNARIVVGPRNEVRVCDSQVLFMVAESAIQAVQVTNKPYLFMSMLDDYVVVRATSDGVNSTGADVLVAKPPELRFSLLTETIDGVVFNYSQHNLVAQTRRVAWAGGVENQVITPRYLTTSNLYAESATTLVKQIDPNSGLHTGPQIKFIEKNYGARKWTKIATLP